MDNIVKVIEAAVNWVLALFNALIDAFSVKPEIAEAPTNWALSRGLEIWAGPIVGVVAASIALITVRSIRVQINQARREATVRDLLGAAQNKEKSLVEFKNAAVCPSGEMMEVISQYAIKRGLWKVSSDGRFRNDVENKISYFYKSADETMEQHVQALEFESHIIQLLKILDVDTETAHARYADDDDLFWGIREHVCSFSAIWTQFAVLVLEAVREGYSKQAASLMLSQWQHAAELHYSIGAIEEKYFQRVTLLIEEGKGVLEELFDLPT